MKNIMLATLMICLGVFLQTCQRFESNNISEEAVSLEAISTIDYCELIGGLDNFDRNYDGVSVRLKGVYMLRFEGSSFYSEVCKTRIPVVADNFDTRACSSESKIEKWDWTSPMLDRAHGVVFVGWLDKKLIEGRSTGEQSKYYKFHVDCVDMVKKLGTFVVYPKSESEAIRAKIQRFEKE